MAVRICATVRMFNEDYKLFQYRFRTSNPAIEHSNHGEAK